MCFLVILELGTLLYVCNKQRNNRMGRAFKGAIMIALGVALIFPFMTPFILRVVVVVLGFYLVLKGIEVILFPKKPSEKTSLDDI